MIYDNRDAMIAKARTKYIDTGITKNITEALAAYLDNDAGLDEQVPLWITSPEIHQMIAVLEETRPRCDECYGELHLQVGARDPEGKIYPTAWICKKCGIEYYSNKSPTEWLEELHLEARKQNIQRSDEPGKTDMPAMQPAPKI